MGTVEWGDVRLEFGGEQTIVCLFFGGVSKLVYTRNSIQSILMT
jgi:hypothetical protein